MSNFPVGGRVQDSVRGVIWLTAAVRRPTLQVVLTGKQLAAPQQMYLFQDVSSCATAARPASGKRTSQTGRRFNADAPCAGHRKPGMELCVLGSGSGGNASAIRVDDAIVMVDLGFGPRTIVQRLQQARVQLDDVQAVCLTHLDQDHFRPNWLRTLLGWRIPVFLHRWHFDKFVRLPDGGQAMADAGLVHTFEEQTFRPIRGVEVSPIRLAHDMQGTSGFRIESRWGSVGYATDLGHVPESLVDHFAGVDVLAIESNYDPPMQLRSPRPAFLKRRIMGGQGHLSNDEAYLAVRRVAERSAPGLPAEVVLLHRSAQCNRKHIIRQVFGQSPELAARVTLTEQRRRTRWIKMPSGTPVERVQTWFEFVR